MKAQATVEYIILISLALLIGLIVLSLIGYFPSFSFGVEEQSSRVYWESATPIAILDTTGSQSFVFLAIKNKVSSTINISNFSLIYGLNEKYTNNSNLIIYPGQNTMLIISAKNCTSSKTFFYNVEFDYSTEEYQNLKFKGLKPVFVRCK
jgi:hypothetical protein